MTTRQSYVGRDSCAISTEPAVNSTVQTSLSTDCRQINQSSLFFDPDNPEKIWKPVVGFEDHYEVSSLGEIKSLFRTKGRYTKERILRTVIINTGYERVKLWKASRGHSMLVHRVVAIAFIPNPDSLPEVNHKDGVKLNNRLFNLEWVTSSENRAHVARAGLLVNPKFKSIRIRNSVASDYYEAPASNRPTWSQLVEKYGVGRTTIARILKEARKKNSK